MACSQLLLIWIKMRNYELRMTGSDPHEKPDPDLTWSILLFFLALLSLIAIDFRGISDPEPSLFRNRSRIKLAMPALSCLLNQFLGWINRIDRAFLCLQDDPPRGVRRGQRHRGRGRSPPRHSTHVLPTKTQVSLQLIKGFQIHPFF